MFGRKKEPVAVQKEPVQPNYLRDLVGSNGMMYEALSNFLLADPTRQVPQLGDIATLLVKGDAEMARGDKLMACVQYEIAAKIAIYRQDEDALKNSLTLAYKAMPKTTHMTILSNIPDVFRIAREYRGKCV